MSDALPPRPSLAWLRKTAKQQLQLIRSSHQDAKLAHAQLSVARQYGFSSWRTLKAHVDRANDPTARAAPLVCDEEIAALLRAVGSGEIEAVRAALTANPGLVNCTGPHPFWGGRPQPLHVSIETKRQDLFELLLGCGADVNGSNDDYDLWTPLMLTFSGGQVDMRRRLLQLGARVGLVEAMLFEDDALLEKLLRRGTRALPKVGPNRGSLLAFARTPFAIDRLLELGVPREQKDRWETSPIEAMSRLGARGAALVQHLLRHGIAAAPEEYARLGARDQLAAVIAAQPQIVHSDAVLMGAVDFGHHQIVTWLLQLGANANARSTNASHCTALHSAAWNGDLPMAELLVAAGADLNARDHEHNGTPCDWAEVAIEVTNQPRCREVADYLRGLTSSH